MMAQSNGCNLYKPLKVLSINASTRRLESAEALLARKNAGFKWATRSADLPVLRSGSARNAIHYNDFLAQMLYS